MPSLSSLLLVIRTQQNIYPLRKFLMIQYSIVDCGQYDVHLIARIYLSSVTETL